MKKIMNTDDNDDDDDDDGDESLSGIYYYVS
jgi:hypothetical protein